MIFKTRSLYVNCLSLRIWKHFVRERCLQFRVLCDDSRAWSTNAGFFEDRNLEKITKNWIEKLTESGIDEPELSVKYIVEKALVKPGMNNTRKSLLMMNIKEISLQQEEQINAMCTRRLHREPIQYIMGDWEFRYLTLIMKPPVFIPRPETEELVDVFTSYHFTTKAKKDFNFLEVGCGSGAVSLSVLVENPQVSCVAIDRNLDAVALTQLNAKRYDVQGRIEVINADIATFSCESKFDAIISNPPYIPRSDMDSLEAEVQKYEDHNALCGGDDGMDIIKMIFDKAPSLLKPYGSIWLEMDLTHPPLVQQWIQTHPSLGLTLNKFYKDFTNR